ncbi:MAG: abortive infection family protein [Chloroflexi bacterium]|nr:abortive infection family protein [Chloroflexota bacterium]
MVNRYIGVQGGYLGDFSYRTHAEFYLEFCDVDIDPNQYEGTTRQRFISILTNSEPDIQARILGGVLRKYPVGSSELRTQQRFDEIQAMIGRLEGAVAVTSPSPRITSDVVERAISDAETLLRASGATSGVDRIHTALHGYLRAVCDEAGITYGADSSLTDMFGLLRQLHPRLQQAVQHASEVQRIIRSFGVVLDALNALRNRGSVAHPNPVLLADDEAFLAINAARTVLHYLDAKISG